jgi:hypothetical protein
MTDDKGAGEGPSFHRCGTPGERSNCKACAYEAGRKAERERCEIIAETQLYSSVGELIAEKIRGGQDGK